MKKINRKNKIFIIKNLLILSTVIGLGFGCQNQSHAYFEDRYFCNIKDSSIIVSLHEDEGFQNCITLSRNIDNKIFQIDDNIAKANKFIDQNEDTEYRNGLKSTFEKQRKNLEYVSDQLNKNMDKFELSLFEKIQKLLSYYLTKQRSILMLKINKAKENITNARKIGNLQNFEENTKTLDDMIVQKSILDAILNSQNFDEMIPFLKYYLKYYKNK